MVFGLVSGWYADGIDQGTCSGRLQSWSRGGGREGRANGTTLLEVLYLVILLQTVLLFRMVTESEEL